MIGPADFFQNLPGLFSDEKNTLPLVLASFSGICLLLSFLYMAYSFYKSTWPVVVNLVEVRRVSKKGKVPVDAIVHPDTFENPGLPLFQPYGTISRTKSRLPGGEKVCSTVMTYQSNGEDKTITCPPERGACTYRTIRRLQDKDQCSSREPNYPCVGQVSYRIPSSEEPTRRRITWESPVACKDAFPRRAHQPSLSETIYVDSGENSGETYGQNPVHKMPTQTHVFSCVIRRETKRGVRDFFANPFGGLGTNTVDIVLKSEQENAFTVGQKVTLYCSPYRGLSQTAAPPRANESFTKALWLFFAMCVVLALSLVYYASARTTETFMGEEIQR